MKRKSTYGEWLLEAIEKHDWGIVMSIEKDFVDYCKVFNVQYEKRANAWLKFLRITIEF